MRETKVEILKWCDMCAAATGDDDSVEQPLPVAATRGFIGSMRDEHAAARSPRLLDVCEMHAKQLDDLAALLHELPRAPEQPVKAVAESSTTRKVPCPVCQSEIARGQLAQHVWARHRNDVRPESPVGKCPQCPAIFDSPQGLAQHRKKTHGFDTLIEALAGVKGYKLTGREAEL